MDRRIKDEWIKALRSGKYQQCQRALRKFPGTHYCCIGVLADIYSKEVGEEWYENKAHGYFTFHDDSGNLSRYILDWADIDSNIERKLIKLNDDQGFSFDQIADWIEENIE